jgi:glycosyltransferase involved in cell wall biosynthesis
MTARRILVVSYPYPPMPSTGANRWAAMTRYLRDAGHDVTVLTTSAFGRLPPPHDEGVVRTADLIASPALRRLTRRPALPQPGAHVPEDKPPGTLLTRLVVPDIYAVTWLPAAVAAARRLVRRERFDCIVTTSPYESGHLVALTLGRRRPPWVADLRDAWTFEPYRDPFPTGIQRRIDAALERRVVTSANRIACVHRALVRDLADRFGVEAAYVPNGWDPALDADVERAAAPAISPRKFTFVHTGSLWGSWGRDPAALFAALRSLRERLPDLGDRFELVLAGRLDTEQSRRLADSGVDDLVRNVGPLTRSEATALQRRADALLLITSRRLSWEAPGKLFEYIAAERPILALADGNEAARVVEETRTGVTVAPDDEDAIAAAIADSLQGGLAERYAPVGTDRYRYPAPAEAMGELIDQAVATA